jgi:hypothetical protein
MAVILINFLNVREFNLTLKCYLLCKCEDYSDNNQVLFSTVAKSDLPFGIFRKLAHDNRTVSLKLIRKADTV